MALTRTNVPILVVEDDAACREVVSTALQAEGFHVDVASNGAEALTEIRRRIPDVILLVLVLPGVYGLEVLAALRADPSTRHLPVIVMTGTVT
jgi:two-component system phosphate regulon response regulator PhoB